MKSLDEIAEEYLHAAEKIKKKLTELKKDESFTNPADIPHKIAVYEDMYGDLMYSYNCLKDYCKK